MIEFRMPSLGADMEAGRLVEWLVKPGDTVHRGDLVAVVDTDKAAIEIEVFHDGVVEKLLVEPGAKVPVGTPLALLRGDATETAAGPAAPGAPAAARPAASPAPKAPAAVPPAAGLQPRVAASPAARRLARERGVELAGLAGTGPGGAITVADVTQAAAGAPAPDAGRRTIANAMSRSKREIPHYYLGTLVNVQHAIAWLEQRNAARPVTERVLAAALLVKAVALACSKVPEMNGHFANGSFTPSAEVRLGFAVALRGGGLVAPALVAPDRQPLDDVMRALQDLVARARAGRLRSSEITGQTITVTSLGERGPETVFGVIHPPQVAIVGFGRILARPVVVDGKVLACTTVHASLSADHRVSDGNRGALFLDHMQKILQEPERLR